MLQPLSQAGGVVYRRGDNGAPRILLVSDSRERGLWIFPKGDIDPGETAQAAAVREVREEAGLITTMEEYLGMLRYEDLKRFDITLKLYLLRYGRESPHPGEDRHMIWVDPGQIIQQHHLGQALGKVMRTARRTLQPSSSFDRLRSLFS